MIRKAVFLATAAAISVVCINARAAENVCAQPSVAKSVIEAFNSFDVFKSSHALQAVDIENLTTISFSTERRVLSCHGVFELKGGGEIEGTVTSKFNVAGEPIVTWQRESLSDAMVSGSTSSIYPESFPSTADQNSSFSDGKHDRQVWEAWFSGLSGEERDGAYYWSAQRSLSHPGSCARLGGQGKIGCMEAKVILTKPDFRRSVDPLYKAGWNSVQSNS